MSEDGVTVTSFPGDGSGDGDFTRCWRHMRATPQAVSFDTTSQSPSLARIRHSSSAVLFVIVISGSDITTPRTLGPSQYITRPPASSIRFRGYLVVDGEGDSDAIPAKNSAGVAAVGYDNMVGCHDGDHGGGSDGVTLWSLELAPANGAWDGAGSGSVRQLGDFLIHFREAPGHNLLPRGLPFLHLVSHYLVHPISAPHGNLRETRAQYYQI
nr:hypothetical protein DVH24_002713 [Ipomoea batatas]